MNTLTIHPSPTTFPLSEMIETGLWAALSPSARVVFAVIWDYHRLYPDACHPSRCTISTKAGVSGPTVTRCLKELTGMGLVSVIPASGPGVNTYRLNWERIMLPEKSESCTKGSPYRRPRRDRDPASFIDGTGRPTTRYEPRYYHHALADGCVVRSADEIRIHDHLVHWKVPHWCGVPYRLLGIGGLHQEATVDFVVAPRTLIEHFGLPRMQGQAARYNRNRTKKEGAITKAGWTLISIEKGENLSEDQFKIILDAWAMASINDAVAWLDIFKSRTPWKNVIGSIRRVEGLIGCARDRQSGKKGPLDPRGFEVFEASGGGPGGYRRIEPRLVLSSHLGRDADPTNGDHRCFCFGNEDCLSPAQSDESMSRDMAVDGCKERLEALQEEAKDLVNSILDYDGVDDAEYCRLTTRSRDIEDEIRKLENP